MTFCPELHALESTIWNDAHPCKWNSSPLQLADTVDTAFEVDEAV